MAREGAAGAAWLSALPRIVDDVLERWLCRPDGLVMHGGVGIIVPVRRQAGGAAVLKVSFPHPGNVHEPDAYSAWGGRGAVLLYERDDARFSMLLERAGSGRPGTTCTLAAVDDTDEIASVAGYLCRRLAIAAPGGLPRLSGQAGAWEDELRRDAAELTHSFPGRVLSTAAATIRELGRVQPDALIHGDLHARNILRADREPWLVVDPKGYAGDPGYDGGTFLKTLLVRLIDADEPLPALRRARDVFADAARLDRQRIWRWAQLQIVQAAFWGRRHGFGPAGEGPRLQRLTEFVDQMAESLTEPG